MTSQTVCEHHADFAGSVGAININIDGLKKETGEIKGDVKVVLERLANGIGDFREIKTRLTILERIVFGMVAVALLAVAGVLLSPIKAMETSPAQKHEGQNK